MDWQAVKRTFLDDYPDAVINDQTRKLALIGIMHKLKHPVTDVGCFNCLKDSLRKLEHFYHIEMAKKEENKKYILKPVEFAFEGMRINQETITDELARKILKKHPQRAGNFYQLPEGWPNDLRAAKKAAKKSKSAKGKQKKAGKKSKPAAKKPGKDKKSGGKGKKKKGSKKG